MDSSSRPAGSCRQSAVCLLLRVHARLVLRVEFSVGDVDIGRRSLWRNIRCWDSGELSHLVIRTGITRFSSTSSAHIYYLGKRGQSERAKMM